MTLPDRVSAQVRRVLAAPPETVYAEWLDPEAIAEFITPHPARSGRIVWEPRVGGQFLIEMVDGDTIIRITGEYLELERPNRLRFTWQSDLGGGFDSVVTVTLEPRDEAETLMTIDHAQLPMDWRADHEKGWTQIASQLAARLLRVP